MPSPYLLFDLGNVIVDLDIPATYRALADLTRSRAEDFQAFLRREQWLERYETGRLEDRAFIKGILDFAEPGARSDDVINAWNAMLVHIPLERLDWLAGLRSSYRVGLLSNTNNLHLAWVHDYLQRHYGLTTFERDCFNEVYYSHHIRLRKPERECFDFAVRAIGVPAADILFIDDLPDNTAAARNSGLRAVTHHPGREIMHWLDHYLRHGEPEDQDG